MLRSISEAKVIRDESPDLSKQKSVTGFSTEFKKKKNRAEVPNGMDHNM
jgi:hypothetical protein